MSKITVVGSAVVFESTLKLEEIERVKKYRPESLLVRSDDEEKNILFVLTTVPGSHGDLSSDSAVFGQKTTDGFAVITKLMRSIPDSQEAIKEMLTDEFGPALCYMNRLEEEIPQVLEAINVERDAIMESIEIA